MLQHIKADVIYYKTASDFEMEFNLCGCARIRLLTEKSPDKKSFGAALSRGVSRSKIIFVIGSLFGADGIISMVSGAIGSSLKVLENKKYGIEEDGSIEIPQGALPLVTPEGIFGGCLIVSGPQTMILLTDSKSIRKSIMNTLIHPYVTELANGKTEVSEEEPDALFEEQSENKIIEEPEISGELQEEIEEASEEEIIQTEEQEDLETEDICKPEETQEAEIQVQAAEECDEDDIILSGGMIYEEDGSLFSIDNNDDEIELFTDSEKIKSRSFGKYNASYADMSFEDDIIAGDEDYAKPHKKPTALNISITVIAVILLLLMAVLCYFIFYVPSKDGVSAAAYIRETFSILFG